MDTRARTLGIPGWLPLNGLHVTRSAGFMALVFAITVALVVGLLAGHSVRNNAIAQAEGRASQDAAHISHIFYYSVWSPINEQVPGLTFAEAMYPQILDVFARRSTFGLSVVELNIHGLDGSLLWSSTGETAASALPSTWDVAVAGQTASQFLPSQAITGSEGIVENRDVVRTYHPFTSAAPDSGASGELLGVISITRDVTGDIPSGGVIASFDQVLPTSLLAGLLALALGFAVALMSDGRLAQLRARLARRDERINELQEQRFQSTKLATVGEIVANVAHEINNPLTAIWGLSQLLLQRDLDPKVRHEVQLVHDEAERSTRIVQNLLSFARARHSEKAYTSINAAVNAAVELRHYHLMVNGVTLDLDLDPALPRTMADPHKVQQVALNLLINAEQAMLNAHGGGRLGVRTAITGNRIRLIVEDDGPGIDPEMKERIFSPFFTTKAEGNGTGLGLSICYSIVQEHGGIITAEDRPDGGTSFVVELPIIEDDDIQQTTDRKRPRRKETTVALPIA